MAQKVPEAGVHVDSWYVRTMSGIYDRVCEALHDTQSSLYQRVENVVYGLIVLSISLFAQELYWGREGEVGEFLGRLDVWILWIFVVEYLLRLLTWRPEEVDFYELSVGERVWHHLLGRVRFVFSPMMLVDLMTVLAVVPLFRGLRALRLLRLLKKQTGRRAHNPVASIATTIEENALAYGFGLSVFAVIAIVGGLSLYLVEHQDNPSVSTIADGIWWAVVTLTTVGFGDIAPVTGLGRLVGGILMICGMGTLALTAGIVGQTLMQSVLTLREEQFRMNPVVNHIVICGYEAGNHMLLDALSHEIDVNKRMVVVFAPGERPEGLPPDFRWISGNPIKDSELEKVRLKYAETVIIVGSRDVLPHQADATTILTAFTVRRYLSMHPAAHPRKRPVYIVAEVLDVENLEHARAAGVDEVIETTRIGFSMVAHAVHFPGMAKVMSSLASSDGQSIFVGCIPSNIALPATWLDVSQALQTVKVLAIGLRDVDTGHDRLQPDPSTQVTAEHQVVYLATGQILPTA